MSPPSLIVGIDLGTTNCAIAFVNAAQGGDAPVTDFAIPQLQRPGEVAALGLLPSCIYLAGEHELPAAALHLPWGAASRQIVGAMARWQGARVPGRLVASAKSWLCHSGVDRSAPILPWGAAADVAKVSPVSATALVLAHLVAAWNAAHPAAPLASQEVVITVPASFDEVARTLTVAAAREAGLENFILLEEPQAAFYDFTSRHRQDLAEVLKEVRLALVVDVGGGTTDFTLVRVDSTPDGPGLRRIAVGDHLMLGGDNMDAALARQVEESFQRGNRKLSATQWTQLVQASREAKEALLGANAPDHASLAVAAEGSRLLGNTLSAEIQREAAERLILDGFFPACSLDEAPRRAARTALQEFGLPYAQDAAITRHLAAFLKQHQGGGVAAQAGGALSEVGPCGPSPRPDAILLNGGVFNSPKIARRLLSVISSWWPEQPPIPILGHHSLDLAVARGAAYYGLARRGLVRRIGGGSAHALYAGLAIDKHHPEARALCLIPRGLEPGQPVVLKEQSFELAVGRPVQFPLFSTSADRIDRPGDIVAISDDFRALPPIHTLFQAAHGPVISSRPVHLRATLTELGTLELWCVANSGDERWRLEFALRGVSPRALATVTESLPARFGEVRDSVERVFGHKPMSLAPKEAKQFSRTLEKNLGPRETWRLPLLRELWSSLYAGAKNRRRSADHERVFFQLAGFSLRPGFGYPLDEWRSEQTFRLFQEGVRFHAESAVWCEFWVMWRRIAGGLTEGQQQELWAYLEPHLARRIPLTATKTNAKARGIQPEGLDEMVRTAASLEHLHPEQKCLLGSWLAEWLKNSPTTAGASVWALGRLGARVPVYGSGHKSVPPEKAAEWLSLLLDLGLHQVDSAPFAVVQLARLTGDRTRDLEDGVRDRAAAALSLAGVPESWLRMLTEAVPFEATDEARALGDTLPIGLRAQ